MPDFSVCDPPRPVVSELESRFGLFLRFAIEDGIDGFGDFLPPGDSRPYPLVRVNGRYREYRNAIAAVTVAREARRLRPGNASGGRPNGAVLDELHSEVAAGVGNLLGPEVVANFSRGFYDDLSRPLTGVLPGLLAHRAAASQFPELESEHRGFLALLIQQCRQRFDVRATNIFRPPRFAEAHRRLLVLEHLGLAALETYGRPDHQGLAALGARALPAAAQPHVSDAARIVEALQGGLMDGMTDRALATLTCGYAGIRDDWLSWEGTRDEKPRAGRGVALFRWLMSRLRFAGIRNAKRIP